MRAPTLILSLCIGLFLLALWAPPSAWSQGTAAAAEPQPGSVEERRIRYSLQQERARLEAEYRQREEKLTMKEMELRTLEAEVDKKLGLLEKMRKEVEVLLAQKEEAEDRRVKGLSRMYEKMEPSKAAQLLTDLEEDLAVDILSGMKAKSAGKVLNAMEERKAAVLSAAYSELTGK